MDLLISVLTVYGLSAIITISKIFEPLRDFAEKNSPNFWKYLTSCMQCLPFWVGIFVSLIIGVPFEAMNEKLPYSLNVFLTYLLSGALFSGTTLIIHTIFIRIKGKKWDEMQEKERIRKIKKGIISEN
ncbi:hypothetical protein RXV94_02610 [Yeosuana sp. MJ-SS3]|uniref:DUF1360 domain-containing protein n=1 Tax=Gilvirhabdus luticola TaxID=3079858 RepID=A0ABU3U3W1_9FLAO|nr:hypothetical protein [Yeosuana sp. MJ-SS3]MDU8885036.1 hypothetical protein [Yeosuana sp. MJ-SS3]